MMSGVRKKILVVEDNLETQLIIKVSLRDSYSVELTNNAGDAIDYLEKISFDLVLLDINLNGEGNGKEILAFIRNRFNKAQLPVIVMTAYDLSDEDKEYFDRHTNSFLTKPIDKKIICGEIEKLVAKIE